MCVCVVSRRDGMMERYGRRVDSMVSEAARRKTEAGRALVQVSVWTWP